MTCGPGLRGEETGSHAGHMQVTCRSHAGLTPSEVQCRLLVVVHEEQNNAPQSPAEGHRSFCTDTHTHTARERERERERERGEEEIVYQREQ